MSILKKLAQKILKEDIENLMTDKKVILKKWQDQKDELIIYKDLAQTLEALKGKGYKFQKIDSGYVTSSHTDETEFREKFQGSIKYLEANGIKGFSLKNINIYWIATHKMMSEYFAFAQFITPCKLTFDVAYISYKKHFSKKELKDESNN